MTVVASALSVGPFFAHPVQTASLTKPRVRSRICARDAGPLGLIEDTFSSVPYVSDFRRARFCVAVATSAGVRCARKFARVDLGVAMHAMAALARFTRVVRDRKGRSLRGGVTRNACDRLFFAERMAGQARGLFRNTALVGRCVLRLVASRANPFARRLKSCVGNAVARGACDSFFAHVNGMSRARSYIAPV